MYRRTKCTLPFSTVYVPVVSHKKQLLTRALTGGVPDEPLQKLRPPREVGAKIQAGFCSERTVQPPGRLRTVD